MNRRGLMFRLAVIAALLGASVFVALDGSLFQSARLEGELPWLGQWAPLLFVMLYALATVLFVPGSAFSLAGGAIFGPVWGLFGIWPASRWGRVSHSWPHAILLLNGWRKERRAAQPRHARC